MLMSVEDSSGSEASAASTAPTYTEQNSQNVGVLEADVVFANASQLFQLSYDAIHVYNTWPAADFTEVGSIISAFTEDRLYFAKMILTDDQLIVFADLYRPTTITNDYGSYDTYVHKGFLVQSYDLQDQELPQLISQNLYTNSTFVTSRVLDGQLHIFGRSDLTPENQVGYYPENLNFDASTMCAEDYEINTTGLNAVNNYLQIYADDLKDYDVQDQLPSFATLNTNGDVVTTEALDCQHVYATSLSEGLGVIWGDTIDLAAVNSNPTVFDVAMQSDSNQVYMNAESVVFYGPVNLWRSDLQDADGLSVDGTILNVLSVDSSQENPYTFAASGLVSGRVDSPWQLDVEGDQLRVVTEVREENESGFSFWLPQAPDAVRFFDLRIADQQLTIEGEIANLVSGEEIYGVRYVGDQAYVVTMLTQYFWDPLFIIDTSDFAAPEVLGSLEMPGFSAYLELLDESVLLGVGFNGGSSGFTTQNEDLKTSLYSVADATLPTEIANYVIEDSYSYSTITHLQIHLDDSDGTRKLFLPYQIYNAADGSVAQKLDILEIRADGISLLQQYDLAALDSYDTVQRTIRYRDASSDVLYVVGGEDVIQLSLIE